MLSHWNRSFNRVQGTPASATEALQTDVMRFIAIIGLCLTAIFSLMRGIADPAENTVSGSEVAALKREIVLLQEKLTLKQESIRILKDTVSDQQAQLAKSRRQAQELKQMHNRLSGLNQALDNKTNEQLRLAQILAKSRDEKRVLGERLQNLRQKAAATKKLAPESQPQVMEPTPTVAEEHPRQGFVLRFASDGVLDELIKQNQVQLLGISRQQAWQLHFLGQQAAFHKAAMPDKYYEMLPETLPAQYRRAFYVSSRQAENSPATWGIQIPFVTEQQIQHLLRTTSAGELIIQVDGSVKLHSGVN